MLDVWEMMPAPVSDHKQTLQTLCSTGQWLLWEEIRQLLTKFIVWSLVKLVNNMVNMLLYPVELQMLIQRFFPTGSRYLPLSPRPSQSTKARKLFNPDRDLIRMKRTTDPEPILGSTSIQSLPEITMYWLYWLHPMLLPFLHSLTHNRWVIHLLIPLWQKTKSRPSWKLWWTGMVSSQKPSSVVLFHPTYNSLSAKLVATIFVRGPLVRSYLWMLSYSIFISTLRLYSRRVSYFPHYSILSP